MADCIIWYGGSLIPMVPFSIVGRRCVFLCAVAVHLFLVIPALCAQESPSQTQNKNVVVGETPQQVNDRIKTLSIGAGKSGVHDYVIGVGDLLDISVFDVSELSKEVRVSQSGTVGMPLVPIRLHVAGLTETQAEEKIAEVLEANGLVSHAEVGVVVKEHRSQPITVVGAVTHPMVYQSDHSVTLLEVLAEAGGIANDAGDTVIVTRRRAATFTEIPNPNPGPPPTTAPGSGEPPALDSTNAGPAPEQKADAAKAPSFPSADEMSQAPPATSPAPSSPNLSTTNSADTTSITINLNDLLETGDTRNNIGLQSGDVVTVPHAGIVYVLGAVSRPGGFVVSNDRTQLTTLKVLSLAGGLTRIAKLDHAVIIRKDDQGKQTQTEIDLKKVLQRRSEDITMHASDILYIPDDRTKEALLRAMEIAIGVGTAVAIFRLAYQ